MINQNPSDQFFSIPQEKINKIYSLIQDFSSHQQAWLSGYLWSLATNSKSDIKKNNLINNIVTIVVASQTGNARTIAYNLQDDLNNLKIKNRLINAGEYDYKKINKEIYLILITSTQGEGEPPEEANSLYDFLMSNRAPEIKNTYFSVFGLGDTSYPLFSQAGKNFDKRLSDLKGKRLLKRVDADIDYEKEEIQWRKKISLILKDHTQKYSNINNFHPLEKTNKILTTTNQYNKNKPFLAKLIKNQKITGKLSNKDIRHIEIDLCDSAITYEPGDALGIWYENNDNLIEEFINVLKFNENKKVLVKNKEIKLYDALKSHFELTVNTPKIVYSYAHLTKNKKLIEILNDKIKLQNYAINVPIIEMVKKFYFELQENQFLSILRTLQPRLYSISSSQLEYEQEVHITVNIIRYKINGKIYTGGASGYLSNKTEENSNIKIFIEKNNNFKLPVDHNSSIIMVGPGTGIAPFRSFMQHRNQQKSKGKNWLFFGNPCFTEDFLYQVEWQKYLKSGLLSKVDLSWSQEQDRKFYVQDKIKQNSAKIWQWLQEGSYFYICGSIDMAKDVEKTLLTNVLSKHGNMQIELAEEFLKQLKTSKHYQRDVY